MSTSGKPNILLIIADDLGADVVLITDRSPRRKMYVMTDAGGPMILGELPILSTLLRCGLYFKQAWATPWFATIAFHTPHRPFCLTSCFSAATTPSTTRVCRGRTRGENVRYH